MNHLVLLLALLASVTGAPSQVGQRVRCISNAALNGSAASRTCTIENTRGEYRHATLDVVRTRDTGTNLTVTCSSTNGSGVPEFVRGKCTCTAGTCACVQDTLVSPGGSASEKWATRVDVHGWIRTACTFASASAGGDDILDVHYRLVTQ